VVPGALGSGGNSTRWSDAERHQAQALVDHYTRLSSEALARCAVPEHLA
jgi:hypothetical protein